MHLMTALEMKQPGVIFRGTILVAQGKTISTMYSTMAQEGHSAVLIFTVQF